MILPPATLGMLGGGQLGRFFVAADTKHRRAELRFLQGKVPD